MDKNFQEEQFTGIIKFTPPLYKQRYQFIKDLVEKYKPKKVSMFCLFYVINLKKKIVYIRYLRKTGNA